MAKVNKLRTLRKALVRGVQYAAVAVAALQTVTVPPDVGIGKQATVVFIIGALGAIAKGIQNYRKTANKPTQYSGYIIAFVGLSLALSGCVTTTLPDGTVTTSVDHGALETMWDRYERLQDRREALEQAPDTPAVTVEIGEVDREIAEARARLEDLGIAIPPPR